jgi:hypothetical protein
MARKGWDALSEKYRQRLIRNHISQADYEAGVSLHRARGKRSAAYESFTKRTTRFVHRFGVPGDSPDIEIERIKRMGVKGGQDYMDYRRTMTKLYESGHYVEAQQMYVQRDKSVPDNMWYYHGMFSG